MKSSFGAGLLMLALFVAQPISIFGQAASAGEAAAARLEKVGSFAIGGVGVGGVTSKGELDYRAVLSQPLEQALQSLEHVYAVGSPAGRAYALLGLHRLAPQRFDELYASVRSSTERVSTMRGCIGSSTQLSLIAKQIDEGGYDRRSTGQLLQR